MVLYERKNMCILHNAEYCLMRWNQSALCSLVSRQVKALSSIKYGNGDWYENFSGNIG